MNQLSVYLKWKLAEWQTTVSFSNSLTKSFCNLKLPILGKLLFSFPIFIVITVIIAFSVLLSNVAGTQVRDRKKEATFQF